MRTHTMTSPSGPALAPRQLVCPAPVLLGPARYCVKKERVISFNWTQVCQSLSPGAALPSPLHSSPLRLMHHAPPQLRN